MKFYFSGASNFFLWEVRNYIFSLSGLCSCLSVNVVGYELPSEFLRRFSRLFVRDVLQDFELVGNVSQQKNLEKISGDPCLDFISFGFNQYLVQFQSILQRIFVPLCTSYKHASCGLCRPIWKECRIVQRRCCILSIYSTAYGLKESLSVFSFIYETYPL